MKKLFPFILIVLIFVQLLAPFTIGSGVNNNLQIRSNKAEAADEPAFDEAGYKNAFPGSGLVAHSTYSDESTALADIDVTIDTGVAVKGDSSANWNHTEAEGATYLWGLLNTGSNVFAKNDFILLVKETKTNKTGWFDVNDLLQGITTEGVSYNDREKRGLPSMETKITANELINTNTLKSISGLEKLTPGENYSVSLYYRVWSGVGSGVGYGENIPTVSSGNSKDYIKIATVTFDAATKEKQQTGGTSTIFNGENTVQQGKDVSGLPVCWGGSPVPYPHVGGCLAQLLYYALFVPTSYIFALAGTFFDFTFHYSVQDTSYRTPFVAEGWGIVRDFCNMFFIFILLYIAFGTILNLHGVKTKEMIINVVIIGLLINFSLFATQIIIDTSNILARVFYNSNTIKITQNNTTAANGVANATPGLKIGPNGEIPLSAAIVNKVNPQNLIINGKKAVVIQDKVTGETGNATQTDSDIGTGAFILITLLATAINVVGIIAFLSIGLLFVARVIGLWMAMIFAPFAFFSYTVPAMQEWDVVGWKKWWPETIKLAFLAPVFIFFMYLIIMFLEKGLSLVKSNNTSTMDGMTFVISIIVPFIFIMILLLQAKNIAKNMSGKMGQAITDGLSKVGGVALGAGIGGLAVASRMSIGRAGSAIANSDWAKRAESKDVFGARALRTLSKSVGSASLDVRGLKIAGNDLGSSTGLAVGKAKEGGFEKIRAEKTIARTQRANELKVGEDSELKQNLNKVETDLQGLLRKNSHDLEVLDKKITGARQNAQDATSAARLDPTNTEKQKEAVKTDTDLTDLKEQKKARRNAAVFKKSDGTEIDYRENVSGSGKSISQLEDHDIPDAHHHLEEENKNRVWNYANYISSSKLNRVGNFISSGGQYSRKGENEAVHKIRMEVKVSGGDKSHKSESHAPAKAPAHAEPKAEAKHDDGHGGGGHGH